MPTSPPPGPAAGDFGLAAIGEAVQDHNADLRREGWIAITMGVAALGFMYLVIQLLCISFLFFSMLSLRLTGCVLVATGLFAVYVAVGWRSAARGVDPEGPELPGQADAALRALNFSVTGSAFNPAYLAAGPAHLLVSGPHSIMEGRERLRSVLPEDPRTLASAGELLTRLTKAPIPLEAMRPASAALVLLRIGFARFEGSGSTTVVATLKGREALSAAPN